MVQIEDSYACWVSCGPQCFSVSLWEVYPVLLQHSFDSQTILYWLRARCAVLSWRAFEHLELSLSSKKLWGAQLPSYGIQLIAQTRPYNSSNWVYCSALPFARTRPSLPSCTFTTTLYHWSWCDSMFEYRLPHTMGLRCLSWLSWWPELLWQDFSTFLNSWLSLLP